MINTLKYAGFGLLGLSLAGFLWLGWFLLSTPSSAFDTQGPGLFGAFVMFASQILGAAGLSLLLITRLISTWLQAGRPKGPA